MYDHPAESKPFSHSKTLWFNLALAGFTVLSTQVELLRNYLNDGGYLAVLMFISVINAYLRTVTKTELRKK